MRRIVVSLLLSLFASALAVGGVALVGKFLRHDRTIALCDIDFNAPPDEDRGFFLAEVQHLADLKDELRIDDDLGQRLAAAFVLHPRVAGVNRVTIESGKHIRVELRYRVAVLAIPVDGKLRTIDSNGILLPPNVSAAGLLVLRDTPLPPLVVSGNTWASTRMLAAVRTAD